MDLNSSLFRRETRVAAMNAMIEISKAEYFPEFPATQYSFSISSLDILFWFSIDNTVSFSFDTLVRLLKSSLNSGDAIEIISAAELLNILAVTLGDERFFPIFKSILIRNVKDELSFAVKAAVHIS